MKVTPIAVNGVCLTALDVAVRIIRRPIVARDTRSLNAGPPASGIARKPGARSHPTTRLGAHVGGHVDARGTFVSRLRTMKAPGRAHCVIRPDLAR